MAKADKAAAKAAKSAQKAEKSQLKSAQKAEKTALKSAGATKSQIKAESKANTAELKALNKAFKSGTYTPTTDLAGIRSEATTYGGDLGVRVGSLLDSAAQNYGAYNIATQNQRGNVTTGIGLDKLVDYELGQTGKKFENLMDRAKTYVGNSFSAADLAAQGVNLKQDKKNPGFYKWSTGGDGNKEITYFTQNPDGTFTGAGINRVRTEAQDGGFFDSTLGKIALGIGGYFLGPAAGGLMGLGTGTLGGTVGGGLLGGVASKLGGGKFAAGVLPGAGGGFAGAGGFGGSLMGTQAAAPITTIDPLTGQVLSTSTAAASSLPSAAPSIFQQAIEGTQDFFKPATDAISRTINPNEYAFPAVERGVQTFTPVPGSLQAALPELGVATQATALPYTAIPGSFAAAAPVLLNNYSSLGLLPSIGSAISRLIPTSMPTLPTGNLFGNVGSNLISSLLQPQQPLPEEMGGGGMAGADANYGKLIAALSAPRVQPRSLV